MIVPALFLGTWSINNWVAVSKFSEDLCVFLRLLNRVEVVAAGEAELLPLLEALLEMVLLIYDEVAPLILLVLGFAK